MTLCRQLYFNNNTFLTSFGNAYFPVWDSLEKNEPPLVRNTTATIQIQISPSHGLMRNSSFLQHTFFYTLLN